MSDAPNAGDRPQSTPDPGSDTPSATSPAIQPATTADDAAAGSPIDPKRPSTAPPADTPAPTTAPSNAEPAGAKPAKADARESSAALDREIEQAMAGMSPEDLATLAGSTPSTPAPSGLDAGVQLGRIEAVQGDDVFVRLDEKRQGVLSKQQFKPEESLAPGEPVEVVIDRFDRDSDLWVLQRKGQARSADWSLLKPGDIVEGRVVGLNRGGLEVQLKGMIAFMPASQVDVMHVKDISIFLNEHVRCEVLEIDRRGKKLTVSRRKILERDRAVKRTELLEEIAVGQTRKAVIGNLAEFGAFADLGGVDGLIHISDMSWEQVAKVEDVVKTGDIVDVKILKIQEEKDGKKRISLGLKQTQSNPWDKAAEQFAVGNQLRVRVVRLADFGAFVELQPGIEGLIPVSEMSWSRIGNPKEVVEVGQTIDAAIIRIELKRRRIALSIEQAQPDPWAAVIESYQPDNKVTGKVTRLADFGAFVELVPGVEGMIHISELSDKRVRTCGDVVKVGQEVEARVLTVDVGARRIGLSLKPPGDGSEAVATADLPKPKPRSKKKKLRGGLSSHWDWAGVSFDDLPAGPES